MQMGTLRLNLATVSVTIETLNKKSSFLPLRHSATFTIWARFVLEKISFCACLNWLAVTRHGSRAVRERNNLFNIRFNFLACVSFLHLYLPLLRKWRHVAFFFPDHSSDIFSSMLPSLPKRCWNLNFHNNQERLQLWTGTATVQTENECITSEFQTLNFRPF